MGGGGGMGRRGCWRRENGELSGEWDCEALGRRRRKGGDEGIWGWKGLDGEEECGRSVLGEMEWWMVKGVGDGEGREMGS